MLRPDRSEARRHDAAAPHPAARGLLTLVRRVGLIAAAVLNGLIGTGLGLVITARAVRTDPAFGLVRIGAWSYAADAGTPDINPYLRARFAATGQIPLPTGEGLVLTAAQDDTGARLRRTCSYRLEGPLPQARFWTIEATDTDGFPLGNLAQRSGFSSSEVLRQSDGSFTIALSPLPQTGNWIPLSGTGRMLLILRLYDTAVMGPGGGERRQIALPSILARSCG